MIGAVSDTAALVLSLFALMVSLAAAVVRPRWLPEALAATVGGAVLVAAGATSVTAARHAISDVAPTVGFLAALLVIAEGCRRDDLFEALGVLIAKRARGSPRRLLALVFAVAAAVTAVLSLDATVVLLTPVVFATSARLRMSPKPHVYACAHMANSASLLLPVSNLTNLLAFHASGLSFIRFASLMALPTLAVVGVEWIVFSRFFATDLDRPSPPRAAPVDAVPMPRLSLTVLGLTLAGFEVSSLLGIAPVWVAAAGATAIAVPAVIHGEAAPGRLLRAAEPGFLVFVLGLGIIVATANDRGLGSAVDAIVPAGHTLADLLVVSALAALLANLVNNLPATLILLPVAAAAGPAAVLAALVGVNVGPNLTYAGSLATLLWRRVLRRRDTEVELGEFLRLGALTVPAALIAATVLLWLAAQGLEPT
jgi:arsenical pump membrane protein